MSKKPSVPSYCRQKIRNRDDQAYVRIDGKRHWLGVYNSDQSKAKYQKLIGPWLASGEVLPREPKSITVMEVLAQWWAWAENHHRDARGSTTSGLQNSKQPVTILKTMFGYTPAADFGPRSLKAIQTRI